MWRWCLPLFKVTVRCLHRAVVQDLNQVNELHVRLDVRTTRSDIIGFERSCRHHSVKLVAEPLLNGSNEEMTDRLDGAGANCFIRFRNRRAQIAARGLEARVGRAFACPVHADQGLEEESVGQLPCLTAQLANGECPIEGLSNLWFVLLLDLPEGL